MYVGSPDSPGQYDSFPVDGITVYVRKGTKTEHDSLTITTAKMLWTESLAVEGMAY